MFTAIPNHAAELGIGRVCDAAARSMSTHAWRVVPRTLRRLVLRACPRLAMHMGPRGWCGLFAAVVLLLLLGEFEFLGLHQGTSGAANAAAGTSSPPPAGSFLGHRERRPHDGDQLLLQDFHMHPHENWRMLLPGSRNNEVFVGSMVTALRARPLGRPCLDYALDVLAPQLDKDSLWLEFGVWMGRSLTALGKKSAELGRRHKVFGFDSFKGLPETWRTNASGSAPLGDKWAQRWTEKGSFDLGGQPPELFVDKGAVDFVVGWFNESLPRFLEREHTPVSLVHIDSDLYASAALVLRLIAPRLRRGAILIFDEIINWPGYANSEARALGEWLNSAAFRDAGLTGVQVIGYRGPSLLARDQDLQAAITKQRGEGRQYPQDGLFRVW